MSAGEMATSLVSGSVLENLENIVLEKLELIPGAGAFIDTIKGLSSAVALEVAQFLAIIRKTLEGLKTLLDTVSDLLGVDVSCTTVVSGVSGVVYSSVGGAGRATRKESDPVQSGAPGRSETAPGAESVGGPIFLSTGPGRGRVVSGQNLGSTSSHESFLDKTSTAALPNLDDVAPMICAIIDFFSGNFIGEKEVTPSTKAPGGGGPAPAVSVSGLTTEQESAMVDYITDFAFFLQACFKSWFKNCDLKNSALAKDLSKLTLRGLFTQLVVFLDARLNLHSRAISTLRRAEATIESTVLKQSQKVLRKLMGKILGPYMAPLMGLYLSITGIVKILAAYFATWDRERGLGGGVWWKTEAMAKENAAGDPDPAGGDHAPGVEESKEMVKKTAGEGYHAASPAVEEKESAPAKEGGGVDPDDENGGRVYHFHSAPASFFEVDGGQLDVVADYEGGVVADYSVLQKTASGTTSAEGAPVDPAGPSGGIEGPAMDHKDP